MIFQFNNRLCGRPFVLMVPSLQLQIAHHGSSDFRYHEELISDCGDSVTLPFILFRNTPRFSTARSPSPAAEPPCTSRSIAVWPLRMFLTAATCCLASPVQPKTEVFRTQCVRDIEHSGVLNAIIRPLVSSRT